MNGRIAVLCPTRERPDQFRNLIKSLRATAKNADILAYLDEGATEMGWYRTLLEEERIKNDGRVVIEVGPRLGPVRSANHLVAKFPQYDSYGFVPDDAVFTTNEWDEFCRRSLYGFRDTLGVVSPHTGQGLIVDMPFVSAEWVKRLGWFAPPELYHFGWTAVLGVLGECTQMVHAKPKEFSIRHDMKSPGNTNHLPADQNNLYAFFTYYFYDALRKLRGWS
jgi:hypothetical protein